MILISLELSGYDRMMLSGRKYFKITPTEVIQLILGTNGSGKSSLLREIFPLPAASSDFQPNGFKEAIYTHRDSKYVLRSSFTPQAHSFIKDGQELNPGKTMRVQQELVRQEFGITPQIRDLLIGTVRFHSMSPLARRELFTQMNDVDFTYGLQLFNRFRDRVRDTAGALRIAKERLVIESAKIMDKTERDKVQGRVNELHGFLTQLLELRTPLETRSHDYELQIRQAATRLQSLSEQLIKNDIAPPSGLNTTSASGIQEAMTVLREQIRAGDDSLQTHIETYQALERDVSVLEASGGVGVSDLRENVDKIDLEIERLKGLQKQSWDFANPQEVTQAFETVQTELREIFSTIESNDDARYTTPRLQELRRQVDVDRDQISQLDRELRQLQQRRDHLEHHRKSGSTTCPKCLHNWVIGFSNQDYQAVMQELEQKSKQHDTTQLRLTQALEEVQITSEYFDTYRRYLRLKEHWPVLQPFWARCDHEGLSYKYPRMVVDLIDALEHDVKYFQEIESLRKEQHRLSVLLDALTQVDLVKSAQSKDQLTQLKEKIEKQTHDQALRATRLETYQQFYERVKRTEALTKDLLELTRTTGQTYQQFVSTLRMEDIHHLIRQVQSELALNEDILAQTSVQVALINDLETQIMELTQNEFVAKLLVQELSPTEGLIAEGMMGFINSFTAQMNVIISKIWSYPMEILPCTFDEESGADLDYRFPMRVENMPKPIPDIVAGSVGMREITDLAFKIVAMKYLGLETVPLFLDEFGAGFDSVHRNSSMAVIRQLINQLSFNQVFMVSHYEASYGSMTGAQICVLCSANIVVPYDHNQHVELR